MMGSELLNRLKSKFVDRPKPPETTVHLELPRKETLKVHDFREPLAAAEANLPPGVYVSIFPTSLEDLTSGTFVQDQAGKIAQLLSHYDTREESGIKIRVNNEGHTVDTNRAWKLSVFGYDADFKILLVVATYVESDSAQLLIAKAIQSKTGKIRPLTSQE